MMSKIELSISQHFMEKNNIAPPHTNKETGEQSNQWAFAAFENVEMDAAAIIAHIQAGKAFSVAHTKDGHRRRDKFVSSQSIGIDFDTDTDCIELVNADTLAMGYAFYAFPTASSTDEHPRARLLFILDRPILDGGEYMRLVKRLMHYYRDWQPDVSTKDEVRLFYGSKQRGMSYPQAVLPVSEIEALPMHPDEIPKPPRPTGDISGNYDAYTKVAIERTLERVTGASEGERNSTLNKAAFALGQLAAAAWNTLTFSEAERLLLNASPLSSSETQATVKSGLDAGAKQPMDAPAPRAEKSAKPTAPKTEPKPQVNPTSPPGPLIVSSSALVDGLAKEWAEVPAAPLPFPLKVMHKFRGMCQMIAPGKLVGIVGASGGMKTSFCETLMDSWRRDNGVDVLYWGPEWTPTEMAQRAIQRYGTIEKPTATYDDISLHKRWNWEEANEVPFQLRVGKKMNDLMYRNSMDAAQTWRNYRGEGFYFQHMDLTLDALLAEIDRHIEVVKAQRSTLRAIVLDYVQLMQLRDVRTETERMETALGLIKAFVVDRQLIGVVASQARKKEAEGMRDAGALLTMESGQFVRSDKFNLVLTLNPIMDNHQLTNNAVISVEKNSSGRTGQQRVVIDPARLRWVDKEAVA